MNPPTKEKLAEQLEVLAAQYEARFAGKPRSTRSLQGIEALVGKMRELLQRIEEGSAQGQDLAELREQAAGNLQIYEVERDAIKEANSDPDFEEAAELATFANSVFSRYFRHFAGKNRATRDLGLLGEMLDDLQAVKKRMTELVGRGGSQGLKRDLEVVERNLGLYTDERGEIVKAQESGTLDEQASLLALLANEQINLYKVHFAGKSRLTRRPALLGRISDSLRRIGDRMRLLGQRGVSAEFNKANIGVVDSNLRMYQTELTEIRKLRKNTALSQIMDQLGEEANKLFELYGQTFGGKDRKTVDLTVLAQLCDELTEIFRQMRDIKRVDGSQHNIDNFHVVMDALSNFEHEYEIVRPMQSQAQPGAPSPEAQGPAS